VNKLVQTSGHKLVQTQKVIISVEGPPDAVEVAAKRVKERAVVPYGEIRIPHSLVNHLIGVRGKRMK